MHLNNQVWLWVIGSSVGHGAVLRAAIRRARYIHRDREGFVVVLRDLDRLYYCRSESHARCFHIVGSGG